MSINRNATRENNQYANDSKMSFRFKYIWMKKRKTDAAKNFFKIT